MGELVYIILSVAAFIGVFYVIYLRGKLLQQTYKGIVGAVREKKQKLGQLRFLGRQHISSVVIKDDHIFHTTLEGPLQSSSLAQLLEKAKMCKFDRRTVVHNFQLDIVSGERTYLFDALVCRTSTADVVLKILEGYDKYGICVAGLNLWLQEHVEGYKEYFDELAGNTDK